MADILEKIIATKRDEIAESRKRISEATLLENGKERKSRDIRNFAMALRNKNAEGMSGVIAEVKKASPSKGLIRPDFFPDQIAASYEKGGAACLSVLTDRQYFQGCPEFLEQARAACSLPVLRKDFIVDPYQVYEAAAMGADAILLIAAVLETAQMKELASLAKQFHMDVLVESHTEEDVEKALQLQGALIGINNRNLRNFTVDLKTTQKLLKGIPDDRTIVTESGIRTKDDVRFIRSLGVNCFLVGEAFMREEHPGQKLRELFF